MGIRALDKQNSEYKDVRCTPDGDVMVSLGTVISGEDQINDVLVVEQGQFDHQEVAANQSSGVALGDTGGAAGDFIQRLVCIVNTPATSQVQIKDGSGSAITVLPDNVAGGIGTYPIEITAKSVDGAWSVITGAGVEVIAIGRFS